MYIEASCFLFLSMSETQLEFQQSFDHVNTDDDDTCTVEELDKIFKHKYNIHDELAVTNDGNYVLKLTKDDSFKCIAAGLSDGSVRIFDINSEKGVYVQPPRKKIGICGVRFVDETPNLLLVGTTNGLVRLLDLRTKNEVTRFVNITKKDILSFDRNSSSCLLALGTIQRKDRANVVLYDMRSADKIFCYYQSHRGDLTSLRFHPEKKHLLCSGSTDGLINIFNVMIDEENAILTTINTNSTVYKINWHKSKRSRYIVSCITHTHSFKSYKFDGDIITDFDRLKITETINRKNKSNCCLIDCHSTSDNNMMLVTASEFNNGSVLRSCKVQNGQLIPYANFKGNNQVVRESIFDTETNILVTSGESGLVTIWTPSSLQLAKPNSSLKMKTEKSHKFTPY